MQSGTAAPIVSSRPALPSRQETHVSLMPHLCRMRTCQAHARTHVDVQTRRERKSLDRNVVHARITKSRRERLQGVVHLRSVAFQRCVDDPVQRVREHVSENETGIERLAQRVRHGNQTSAIPRRLCSTRRHRTRSNQDQKQSRPSQIV